MSVKSVKSQIDIHICTHQVATHIHRDRNWTLIVQFAFPFSKLQYLVSDANIRQNTR